MHKEWSEKLDIERGAQKPLAPDLFVRGLCVAINDAFTQRAYFKARLAAASTKASPLEVDLLAARAQNERAGGLLH
jgi:hypothetical protein